jgi:hypothetical protein
MRLKNTFVQGKMNRDIDERLLPKGQYPNAENIRVANTDSSDMGAVENVMGNKQLTTFGLTNAKTIGAHSDTSNQKLYWFITSDEKDLVVEYDVLNDDTKVLLESTNPSGILGFNKNYLITGVNKVINGDSDRDLLMWTDNINPPRVVNIKRAKDTYLVDGFIEDDISVIKKPPIYPPALTFATLATSENYLEDKFLSFAYRYKYLDGEYSAISTFTNYAFRPQLFDLDYQTMENDGMINSFNQIMISFNTGSNRVTDIELIFKESNSNVLNIIERFKKSDEGWADDIMIPTPIPFTNSKKYTVLPEDELFRTYDNVPRLAKAQEIIGNRLVYGNYLDGYDIKDVNGDNIKMDYDVSLLSNDLSYTSIPYIDVLAADADGATTMIIDVTGVPLDYGVRLNLNIIMTAVGGTGSFSYNFIYILNQDYSNATELRNDTDFQYFVEQLMSSIFEDNVQVTEPDDTINIAYGTFSIAGGDGNTINIKAPKITFTIDDTPADPNDNPTNTHPETFGFDYSDVTDLSYRIISSDTSLKTLRSYEIGLLYADDYNRSSTVLTDNDNTLYIEQKYALSQNKIVVDVNHPAPDWASTYKFVIKQNKRDYFNIFVNFFYEDRLFRWVRLEGANKNKVKEGDTLIVKSDLSGFLSESIRVTVLEIKSQDNDFILNNVDALDEAVIEEAGTYMKIKPVGFNMDLINNRRANYRSFEPNSLGDVSIYLPYAYTGTGALFPDSLGGYLDEVTGLYVDYEITAGTRIGLFFEVRQAPEGLAGDVDTYDESYIVQGDYDNFEDWFNAEVIALDVFESNVTYSFDRVAATNQLRLIMTADEGFAPSMEGVVDILFSEGDIIFETDPQEIDTEIFYETGQVFNINNGVHEGNIQDQVIDGQPAICELEAFNCYIMGNGAESYSYKDLFNSKKLNIDLRPASTSIEPFKANRRFADITYSEVYNENNNLNGINEFNLAKANYKEDIEKKYGYIEKLHSRDTDMVVFQEDKVSKVLYGKDLLMNADGTSNVSSVEYVLGQQIPFKGEYGISRNPESFAFNGYHIYFTDAKRGAVMRLGNDGLTEISNYGLRQFFRDGFKNSIDAKKIGAFDPYQDQYVLHPTILDSSGEVLSESRRTITFDERVKGWTSFHSFYPDYMIGMNSEFFTFKNGDLFIHHSDQVDRNNYYGDSFPSKVSVMINDNPSEIKELQAVSLEGNYSWNALIKAYISNVDDFTESSIDDVEFIKKEGIWYAYARRNEDETQQNSKSMYGIGSVLTIQGSIVTIKGNSDIMVEGDVLVKGSDMSSIGVISNTSYNSVANVTTLTVSSVVGLSVGDFVAGKKEARIEGGNLRGYTMRADLEIEKSDKVELFAVNTEVMKSYA